MFFSGAFVIEHIKNPILTAVLVDDKDVNDMESAAEEISR